MKSGIAASPKISLSSIYVPYELQVPYSRSTYLLNTAERIQSKRNIFQVVTIIQARYTFNSYYYWTCYTSRTPDTIHSGVEHPHNQRGIQAPGKRVSTPIEGKSCGRVENPVAFSVCPLPCDFQGRQGDSTSPAMGKYPSSRLMNPG